MHADDISVYTHEHVFDLGNPAAERGTRIVMWVTAMMMVIEIAGGVVAKLAWRSWPMGGT